MIVEGGLEVMGGLIGVGNVETFESMASKLDAITRLLSW